MKNSIRLIVRLLTILLAGGTLLACAATPEAVSQDARLLKATALFAKRCEVAGEKIYRTVDNVEGIFLLKRRPADSNYYDQFALNDPYGNDSGGDGYIETFLRGGYETSPSGSGRHSHVGYLYVDVLDDDGIRYRYTGGVRDIEAVGSAGKKLVRKAFVPNKVVGPSSQPRYGVTYKDVSTPEERDYWIAGSLLKIVDLQTNEVIAERLGYMMDNRQGDRASGRAPWQFAANNACPAFSDPQHAWLSQFGAADKFVERVLKPTDASRSEPGHP